MFDYVGAGTKVPKFLSKKLFKEENKKLDLDFINLNSFYKSKEDFNDSELKNFLNENKNQLKIEYIDFDYGVINPLNLIGVDEFNQAFFDKIDDIEVQISNNVDIEKILEEYNIKTTNIQNFKFAPNEKEIEKKIFESRNIEFDIFEYENDYILYKIKKTEEREPSLNDPQIKKEILELVYQKNKFDFHNKLLEKIDKKEFSNDEFSKMAGNNVESILLNSIKDNKKFKIEAVELLYSLPVNA